MKHNILGATCAVLWLAASGAANAALYSRLGGLAYYDDVTNVTWLADANYAHTSGYSGAGPQGGMNWSTANAWAASLNIDGVTGWQLPNTVQPDPSCGNQSPSNGYNCTGSPMGELFYNELGNVAGYASGKTNNYNPFSNVGSYNYWSATESNTNNAWYFNFYDGFQSDDFKTNISYAWAVHAGDVAAVPVPAAAWLFGSGLLGLIGIVRLNPA